ncbi:hypothetical protein J5500_00870 [Candidatus Saccharibacteria bacterium]|nr:hypothetical protein [Candidatus Saccharibacteria bacterium]
MGYTWVLLIILLGIIFNPLTWIIVGICLFVRHRRKKKAKELKESLSADKGGGKEKIPEKATNPMAKWNWLLYVGSFLIVLAMIYFVDSVNDDFVAPFTIILTMIIYATGIAIHKSIDYLRPVGKAFVYSALCMIPLWTISLTSIGLPSTIVPFWVALVFVIASFASAPLINDSIMAHIAYLSIAPLVISIYSAIESYSNSGVYYYFVYLSLIIAAIPPTLLNISESKWLPAVFHTATETLGKVLMPIAYSLSLFLFFVPNISTDAPLLRFICAVFFLGYSLAYWLKAKSHKRMVAVRLAIQAIIVSFVFDLLGVSLVSTGTVTNITPALICAIVWLLSFTIQIILSLYVPRSHEDDNNMEYSVSTVSIICIYLTPALCSGFSSQALAAVWLTICLITAILGIIHALHYKNVSWSLATAASIMVVPLIIGNYIAVPKWEAIVYLGAYSIIALLFLAGCYFLRRIQEKQTDQIGVASIIAVSLAIIMAAIGADKAHVGFMIVAIIFTVFAVISKIKYFYEAAVYSLAFGLLSFTNTQLEKTIRDDGYYGYSLYDQYSTLRNVIHAHIFGAALVGGHAIANAFYANKTRFRLVLGYTFFSIIMTGACLNHSFYSNDIMWSVIFLVEQVGALIYSVTKRVKWMIWFSSIEILIIAFKLTGGMSYLWLGIIGVGLIVFVIWQLKKANDKQLNSNAQTPPNPPENKTE